MTKNVGPLPSVDEVLRGPELRAAIDRHGHQAALAAVREALAAARTRLRQPDRSHLSRQETTAEIVAEALAGLDKAERPRLRRVFNLTGTVLHTNLGRAILADEAVMAAADAMRHPAALEFDLGTGGRGERDDVVRDLVRELTGAEDVLVVNNNAAAVFLVLNTLALGRETVVSRGELIEIGGAFRIPDIMARAGTRLVEVGTTNRTHLKDYVGAVNAQTALLMKVHTSNYRIEGFTKEVTAAELAPLAREHAIPLVDDLGSGTLVDLGRYGLTRERTVRDAVSDGADLVTFSGDKLLGGPQAGFVVGRRDLVAQCAKNPLKRAMRLDKVRLAALEATLRLYRNPDTLAERLPTLRYLTRPVAELQALAARVMPAITAATAPDFTVDVRDCTSQIGSGALPTETIPSLGIAITPVERRGAGSQADQLARSLRGLPIPVIGRIDKGALLLDLRCLDDEAAFVAQLGAWRPGSAASG
ncbi:MAG: L-seryl-tRNA(Sec) selenium transferase [Hyphomicrobiaceae bacterium]